MSRSRSNSASLNERTAMERQNNLLVPLGGMFPCKFIHFLEDFDRWAAIRPLYIKYNYQTPRLKVGSALWDERTATKRQDDLLVPFKLVFPRKLIQFLEDFDRAEANRPQSTPATNITEEGDTFLLLF